MPAIRVGSWRVGGSNFDLCDFRRVYAVVSPPFQKVRKILITARALFLSLALSTKPTFPPIKGRQVARQVAQRVLLSASFLIACTSASSDPSSRYPSCMFLVAALAPPPPQPPPKPPPYLPPPRHTPLLQEVPPPLGRAWLPQVAPPLLPP